MSSFFMVDVVPLVLLAVAAWHDLRTREIPDWISLALAAWALVLAAGGWHSNGWTGLVLGGLLGFVLTAPLFWLGGLGGGDVKLLAALGACLGPGLLLLTLFWMAIAGGVLALVAKCRGKADFAYVPAILAGLALAVLWPGAFSHVLAK
jgi:prepilin peptidase CpaA